MSADTQNLHVSSTRVLQGKWSGASVCTAWHLPMHMQRLAMTDVASQKD